MSDPTSPAYKLFIKSLVSCVKKNNDWFISFDNKCAMKPLHRFQLQVTIVKLAGLMNEIMIVSDQTGKAKITRSDKVPGDFSWLKPGVVCSIVGSLLENGKLPHIEVMKMARIDNPILIEMWPYEVIELSNFMTGKILPKLESCPAIL